MRRKPTPSSSASTRQRRWPDHADGFRVAAIETSEASVSLINEATQLADQMLTTVQESQTRIDLLQITRLLVEVAGLQEYLQKLLIQARLGRD